MTDQFIGQPVKGHADKDNGENTGKGNDGAAAGSTGIDDIADTVFGIDLFADGDVSPADTIHHGEGLQDTGQGAGQQNHSKNLEAIHAESAGSKHQIRADFLKGENNTGQHVDECCQKQETDLHLFANTEPQNQ